MRIANIFTSVLSKFRPRLGSLMVLAGLSTLGTYAIIDSQASSGGISGQTQKSTSAGCSCHCATQQTGTTVTLSTSSGSSPLTAAPSTGYTFTVTVANSSESYAGIDISSYS